MTLSFDPWPWAFAWTSLLSMVIAPENFTMIRREEHREKGVTGSRLVVVKNRWFFRLGMKLMFSFIHSWNIIFLGPIDKIWGVCVCALNMHHKLIVAERCPIKSKTLVNIGMHWQVCYFETMTSISAHCWYHLYVYPTGKRICEQSELHIYRLDTSLCNWLF